MGTTTVELPASTTTFSRRLDCYFRDKPTDVEMQQRTSHPPVWTEGFTEVCVCSYSQDNCICCATNPATDEMTVGGLVISVIFVIAVAPIFIFAIAVPPTSIE